MDDKVKLVTLAIHSLEKAQALQLELEANGIDSIIQHVGDSIVTRNVRVRIKESDLDRATAIVEEIKQNQAEADALRKAFRTTTSTPAKLHSTWHRSTTPVLCCSTRL